jgi:hypothetical protein
LRAFGAMNLSSSKNAREKERFIAQRSRDAEEFFGQNRASE